MRRLPSGGVHTLVLGFTTSLALIVAIGAQSAFILRQGLARRHVPQVVALCAASDAVLISAGVAGLGMAVTAHPWALNAVRYGGAAFLAGYAVVAVGRAMRPRAMIVADRTPDSLRAVIAVCLAVTFLNPHVYLDTVVLLGSLANQHGPDGRWLFGAGALLGSTIWFVGLGFGARWLTRYFERPMSWRVLDGSIAAVMLALGVAMLRSSSGG